MEKTTTTTTQLIGTTLSLLCSLFISSDPPMLPELPFELVAEILCRLPVRFLLQLRCLSKSLKTLISDPKFAKKHLRCLSTTRHLILSYADIHDNSRLISYSLHSTFHQCDSIFNSVTVKPTTYQLRYPFNKRYNNIAGSCHGILCLTRKQCMHDKQNDVLLWNPSIRKFKILPSFKSPPNSRPTLYGFGYDCVTNVYKILAVFSCDCGNMVFKAQGMVHTLGTNSWRMIHGELPLPDNRYESLKFVSGALDWIAYSDNNHSVVSFNLGIESYGKFSPPIYGGEDVRNVILGVSRDCLCIFARSPMFSSVWLMKEYGNGESWTKLFRIPYIKGPFHNPYTKPLWISEDDQVLIDYTSSERINLAVYDFKNGTFRKLLMQDIKGWINSAVCVESLISPCF